MIYDILMGISVISCGVLLAAFILVAMLFLNIIGTEAQIEAEEYRKQFEDELNHNINDKR